MAGLGIIIGETLRILLIFEARKRKKINKLGLKKFATHQIRIWIWFTLRFFNYFSSAC